MITVIIRSAAISAKTNIPRSTFHTRCSLRNNSLIVHALMKNEVTYFTFAFCLYHDVWIMCTIGGLGRYIGRYASQSTVGRLSTDCRPMVGRVATDIAPDSRVDRHSIRPSILDRYLTDTWPILDRYTTVTWPTHDRHLTDSWSLHDRYFTDTWPTLDRYFSDTSPKLHWYFTDTWTNYSTIKDINLL